MSAVNTWATYVRRVTKGATNQTHAADTVGVNQTTISRWINEANDSLPSVATAAAFARAYNGDVLEAFVAAGFLTAEEANATVVIESSLNDVSGEDLAAEVTKRLTEPKKAGVSPLRRTGAKQLPTRK